MQPVRRLCRPFTSPLPPQHTTDGHCIRLCPHYRTPSRAPHHTTPPLPNRHFPPSHKLRYTLHHAAHTPGTTRTTAFYWFADIYKFTGTLLVAGSTTYLLVGLPTTVNGTLPARLLDGDVLPEQFRPPAVDWDSLALPLTRPTLPDWSLDDLTVVYNTFTRTPFAPYRWPVRRCRRPPFRLP